MTDSETHKQAGSRGADLGNPWHLLAFGFGSGLSPKAPGTAGTALAVLLYLPLQLLPPLYYLGFVLAAIVFGVWLCDRVSSDLGVHDHGGIVWDEFAGYWLTMCFAPPGFASIIMGFCYFRLFDILKPWPVSWADQRISGGLGVMLDDVLAGVLALGALQLSWLAVSML
jgi:phosphatidylglycerophosphatase A